MTTATVVGASAVSADVIARPPDRRYSPTEHPSFSSYVVPVRPAFALSHTRTETGWVVTDRPSGIHGYGEDVVAALNDFMAAAREHLDVLERQEALSDDLIVQRDYLRARILV